MTAADADVRLLPSLYRCDDPRSGDAHARERAAPRRVRARGRRRRSGARLPGRSGRRRPPSCCIPTGTFPASCDSKMVPARRARAALRADHAHAVAWAVAAADPAEIDRINIHQASLRAMQRAVLALAPLPDIVLVDAFRVPDLPMAQRGVAARRSALLGDRRRVDRRQGDARSPDARAARRAIRATGSIATRATRPPIISTPSRGSATRTRTAGRSGRRTLFDTIELIRVRRTVAIRS